MKENTPQSLLELVEYRSNDLKKALQELTTDGGYQSPDVTDLLFWNVVVGFFLGIASNATFDTLKEQFFSRPPRSKTELGPYMIVLQLSHEKFDWTQTDTSIKIIAKMVSRLQKEDVIQFLKELSEEIQNNN